MRTAQENVHTKVLGRQGEELTVKYLKKHGYKILERNYKTPFGEADIVARKKDTYCFIEVKTRVSASYSPAEAVNEQKQQRYRLIARYFVSACKREVDIRFDVASVTEEGIEYFENAFQ